MLFLLSLTPTLVWGASSKLAASCFLGVRAWEASFPRQELEVPSSLKCSGLDLQKTRPLSAQLTDSPMLSVCGPLSILGASSLHPFLQLLYQEGGGKRTELAHLCSFQPMTQRPESL